MTTAVLPTSQDPRTESVSPGAQAGVRLEGVSKRFGALWAVRDVSLEIRPGEFFSLLGPSGCGKSTLLRTIAGFEEPDAGRVFIGERDVTRVRPQERPSAMVFQSYALFPTMTVEENVAYGLQAQGLPRAAQRERVADVLARVDLSAQAKKPVTALSGGQQQRVALARAVAVSPAVLLFDEPLSNLDVALREQTRRELKQLQHTLGTTSVYVTHDQQEALSLSDRIAVMRAGRVVEVGTPRGLYETPRTAYAASFFGSNVIHSPMIAAKLASTGEQTNGVLAVRPEDVRIDAASPLRGRVRSTHFMGAYAEWWIEAEGEWLRAWVDPGLEPAEEVGVSAVRSRWVEDDGSATPPEA